MTQDRTIAAQWPIMAAVVLAVSALTEALVRDVHPASVPVTLVLALAMTAPIALVRAQPALAASLVLAAGFVTLLGRGEPPVAGLVGLAGVLYLVGRRCSREAVSALAVAVGVCVVAALHDPVAFTLLATAGAAMVVGVLHRVRIQAAQREATLDAMADTLLEHVARGERARIARELHDVVAHHISLIAVEADAARLATVGMPPEGVRRPQSIGDTARSALTEMRRLLGVLRADTHADTETDTGTDTESGRDRRPQPGLRQLNDLLDATRGVAAGSARLIVQGQVRPLDPGVELTAYRIVQESLSNSRRHAPGAVSTSTSDTPPTVCTSGSATTDRAHRRNTSRNHPPVTASPACGSGPPCSAAS